MKKFTAVLMVLMLVIGCLGACSSTENRPQSTENETTASSSKAASSKSSSSKSASSKSTESLTGTGENNSASLSITLFDEEYIVGKSKVKDMVDNDWGYDPESWKDVNMDEKIEYKKGSNIGRTLDNSTTEVEILYENLAETFAVPEDCIVTTMKFSGSTEGSISKAGVKLFGGKVDLASNSKVGDFEEAMCSALSSIQKKVTASGIDYSVSIANKGTVSIETKTTGDSITDYDIQLKVSSDYTYEEE